MTSTRRGAADERANGLRTTPPKTGASQEARGPKGLPQGPLISEPLRREAERTWAESDCASTKGERRNQARWKWRHASQQNDIEIARVTGTLARAKKELIRQRPSSSKAGRDGWRPLADEVADERLVRGCDDALGTFSLGMSRRGGAPRSRPEFPPTRVRQRRRRSGTDHREDAVGGGRGAGPVVPVASMARTETSS